MWLVVRSASDPMGLSASIRETAQALEANLPVANLRPLDGLVGQWVKGRRAPVALLTFFAGVALLLAALGIYGVISYSVAQRTREVGIRMALGAQGTNLVALIFREGLTLTLTGVLVGLAVTLPMTHLMERMLFGITATDPITLAVTPLVLGTVAILAISIPVRRAIRLDPNTALRSD